MKTYFFVDEDGTENVSNVAPVRNSNGFWEAKIETLNDKGKIVEVDAITEMPPQTIESLFGITLTFNDEPYVSIAK